jgi:type II secretion system protein J
LDTVQGNQPVVQDLLSGIKAIQLRYLDGNQTWQSQWPPPGLAQPESLWTRPAAVEIIIEFKDWGRIRRLIEVAG